MLNVTPGKKVDFHYTLPISPHDVQTYIGERYQREGLRDISLETVRYMINNLNYLILLNVTGVSASIWNRLSELTLLS
jgi:hypothetical protein